MPVWQQFELINSGTPIFLFNKRNRSERDCYNIKEIFKSVTYSIACTHLSYLLRYN